MKTAQDRTCNPKSINPMPDCALFMGFNQKGLVMDESKIIFCDVKPRKDLTGDKFGKLTVTRPVGKSKCGHIVYECVCDCDGNKYVNQQHLIRGTVKSCCLKEMHGKSNSPEHLTLKRMKNRCLNKNHNRFFDYGGRGIKICDRWLNSFSDFLSDMGEKPFKEAQIDRKDNDGDYTPDNCRWVTAKQNSNNKRNSHFLYFDGDKKTVTEWARHIGLKPDVLFQRIKLGWSTRRMLTTPVS